MMSIEVKEKSLGSDTEGHCVDHLTSHMVNSCLLHNYEVCLCRKIRVWSCSGFAGLPDIHHVAALMLLMLTCGSWIWLWSHCSSESCWQGENTPEQSFKMGFMIYRQLVSLYVCVCVSLTESHTYDFLQLTDRWMLMFQQFYCCQPELFHFSLTQFVFTCLSFLDKSMFLLLTTAMGKKLWLTVIKWEMLTLTVRCSDRHQVKVKSMKRREWISSV